MSGVKIIYAKEAAYCGFFKLTIEDKNFWKINSIGDI